MSLFRLDASIRVDGSASRELADAVEAEWQLAHPGDAVVRRHVGTEPIPSTTWGEAVAGSMTPEDGRTPEQRGALALASELVDELTGADAVLLAVPLYNYGVSQHLKAWVDLVIAGSTPGSRLLEGTPTVLATVRGGNYSAGTPREGWDHSTGYLRRILADVWGADLTVVERDFTLVGVNPALDAFTEQAKALHTEALSVAREAGRALGVVPVA
ncbi:flavodoxin family protein [Streptomyces sp. NP160]|uniref:FMN-dependent NADH-azoreductase n=1 Tax=Streptomyces sp. NP160 TaxID=2586637 RepID=UPI0011190236|nr:NAD(P)H-dependent oxidoreductase [Streptomyces sp. NP160]TNM64532.1 flavodoxin family protein [Streptomyces sp. NP160]